MITEKKFLPIGTVVLLKNGKKEVMILSYCIFPKGDIYEKGKSVNGEGRMFDYGACTYPEGLISSDQILCFNHDNIERICYMGYETDGQKEFSDLMNQSLTEADKIVTQAREEVAEKENTTQEQ